MEKKECLVIDTLLNPRKFFSGPGERAAARQLLENKKEEEGKSNRNYGSVESNHDYH